MGVDQRTQLLLPRRVQLQGRQRQPCAVPVGGSAMRPGAAEEKVRQSARAVRTSA